MEPWNLFNCRKRASHFSQTNGKINFSFNFEKDLREIGRGTTFYQRHQKKKKNYSRAWEGRNTHTHTPNLEMFT